MTIDLKQPDPARRISIARICVLLMLLLAIAAALALLFYTPHGREMIATPQKYGHRVQQWSSNHHLLAPLAFVGIYLLLGTAALPVWWLQLLAGHAFGIPMGILWTQIAATLASISAASASRFIFADFFQHRIKSHTERLQKLNDKLGQNGFLVVCAVRIAHFIPAGLSNYAFGLTKISIRDVAVGTFLGGLPTAATWVMIGAAKHPFSDWRYLTLLVAMNALLLIPLLLRYLRPEWFKRFGIE